MKDERFRSGDFNTKFLEGFKMTISLVAFESSGYADFQLIELLTGKDLRVS